MAYLDEGSILGGRYLITSHVMTSGDQDIVLTGLDQVLNRDVIILVASPYHASKVATSARELATGEHESPVQILDLGLSNDRTYLVAADTATPQDLLALVSTHDVYVEPFYTETLGSEIFGESRSYEPQTFDDDAEYYSELDQDLAASADDAKRRPGFLNQISDRLNDRFVPAPPPEVYRPGAAQPKAGKAEADKAEEPKVSEPTPPTPKAVTSPDVVADEGEDTAPNDTVAPAAPTPSPGAAQPTEPVQPAEPGQQERRLQDRVTSAMGTAPVESSTPDPSVSEPSGPFDTGDYITEEYEGPEPSSRVGLWIGAVAMFLGLVLIVVVAFRYFGEDAQDEPIAEDQPVEAPVDEDEDEESEPADDDEPAPAGAEPVISDVTVNVPGDADILGNSAAEIPNLTDGNTATTWETLSFAQPQFGGFAPEMSLIFQLEEESEISEVVIEQQSGTGGSFEIIVADEADPSTGEVVSQGSYTGPTYTANVPSGDDGPVTGEYVILKFTELPTLSNPRSADRPYGMRLAQVEIN